MHVAYCYWAYDLEEGSNGRKRRRIIVKRVWLVIEQDCIRVKTEGTVGIL